MDLQCFHHTGASRRERLRSIPVTLRNHSAEGKATYIACQGNAEKCCMSSLSPEALAMINRVLYSTAVKEKPDATPLSCMATMPVKLQGEPVVNQTETLTENSTVIAL